MPPGTTSTSITNTSATWPSATSLSPTRPPRRGARAPRLSRLVLRTLQWGGDLPFDEGTLRALRGEMWSDENIYTSHLSDEPPQPRRLDFPVSKAKQATSPSQIYAPLPPISSTEYRTRYEAANTYHDVNHRSPKQMERDIATFGGSTGLQPGDPRLVQLCAVCMLSLPPKRAPHFSESFSPEEKQPPGTVWVTVTSPSNRGNSQKLSLSTALLLCHLTRAPHLHNEEPVCRQLCGSGDVHL